MSHSHIDAIRTKLENNHWVIKKERLVEEYDTSAYWDIARPDGSNPLTIQFSGGYHADGLRKRTFHESIGCNVVEHSDVSLYFARIHRSWCKELNQFVMGLNQLG